MYLNQQIDLFTAVLGGEFISETLSGKVKVKVQEGTQSGKTIRIKGKGLPVYGKNDQFGNLYLQLNVKIPTDLTSHEKELFEELKSQHFEMSPH